MILPLFGTPESAAVKADLFHAIGFAYHDFGPSTALRAYDWALTFDSGVFDTMIAQGLPHNDPSVHPGHRQLAASLRLRSASTR